ncbi:hypothetical protein [Ornithinibacillus halophilus]|uniref:Uncharacterized protein n=1 Tax=Ornithinibacillus halophilus TaxID=930117 RepID=A0A1M5GPU9_9BACI|nr:hypothetical protein [Ornithinibacillus halophilus]SHG05687.1 hypothetical protein SAMN05216225_10142 [Ornithinibacillus halophilus]
MELHTVDENALEKGLEVYAKEEHIIYKDINAELIATKEARLVKARIEYWQSEFVNPYNTKKALYVVYRRFGTNDLNQLPLEHIFTINQKPHCWKCNRSLDQLTMEICSTCEMIKCPHDGACSQGCSTKN